MSADVKPPHLPAAPIAPFTFTIPLPPPAPPVALEWAERYAERDLRPMAVRPNGKAPLATGWQTAAPDDTCALLRANPGANLAIAVPPGLVVLDVDVKGSIDGRATLAAFEFEHGRLPSTLRAVTPSGGMHLWFKAPGGFDLPNAVGFAPGLDTRSGGKGYVLVEPSVIDGRSYRWENWGAEIADAPEWLLRATRAGRAAAAKPTASGEALRIPAGMRNHELFDRAIAMRKVGFTTDEIRSAIAELNRRACEPPLDDHEVRTLVASAAKYEPDVTSWQAFGDGAPLPPGALPAGALTEKRRSAEWSVVPLQAEGNPFDELPHVVDKWIPQDEVTLLAGHGGGGKSYVALSIAVHVALGRSFGPLGTHQANVLFYSAEDGGRVLQSRLARLCRHLGVSSQELAGRLILLDASDIDPTLFRKSALQLLERLAATAKEHRAALVVIDNASDAFDGDEIKRAEVRTFIRSLRAQLARPGRAVLLLAHVNKLNAKGGGDEDYSGSTAWHNSVRSRLSLKPALHDTLAIEHAKANHGPKAEPLQFVWKDGVPVLVSSAPVDHIAHAERREQQRQGVVDAIGNIERRRGHVPSARTGVASTFRVLSADRAFPEGVDSKVLGQLLDELQDAGRVYRKVIKTPGRKQVEVYSCTAET